MVDDGNGVDIIFFDFAKAFNKVSHVLLLQKLEAYRITGKLLHWIKAWLAGRRQHMMVGNAKSAWLEVKSGTTQGTLLGFL